ncbi:MAG TPA: DnaB-like helicase C-terminal domain-containing protein [Opitutus sp.]|nr:DnaB-like helicase C-terminal domain-containing protein [Opitutus sp.]
MSERIGLPHDHHLERKVLNLALHFAEHRQLLVDELLPSDFYADGTRAVFEGIARLHRDAGQNFDLATLTSASSGSELILEFIAAAYELTMLSLEEYEGAVERLRQLAEARTLARACLDVGACGLESAATHDPNEFLQRASERLTAALAGRRQKRVGRRLGEVLDLAIQEIVAERPVTPRIVAPSGIDPVDRALPWRGFASGELAIVLARPGIGKTSFALQIARNNAVAGLHTAVFSYEMSELDVGLSVLSQDARIPVQAFARKLSADTATHLVNRAGMLSDIPLYIFDCAGLTLEDLANTCRAMKRKGQLDLVAIDYLQLMRMRKRYQSRFEEIGDIATALKLLSRELDVPFVVLSQSNRDSDKRGDKRPVMSDIAQSGQIERDADRIIGLHRECVYDANADKTAAEAVFLKNRKGDTGIVRMRFDAPTTTFSGELS